MQLDAIDGAGHEHGYGSPEYIQQIHVTDGLAGLVLDAIEQAGLMDQSLIILLSDHGGVDHGHGSDHLDCTTIFWACCGPQIGTGRALQGPVGIADTAAVVAQALGLEAPEAWNARVPDGLFA